MATEEWLRRVSGQQYERFDGALSSAHTVNFDNSMTTAEMQALIDAVPKNLNGNFVTFQFADGTYTMTGTLYFRYFFSGGITIQGNTGDPSTLTTAQSVHLNAGSSSNHVIDTWFNNVGVVTVRNLKITVNSTGGYVGLYAVRSGCPQRFLYNYITGNGTSNGYGSIIDAASAYLESNYFSNINRAIETREGAIVSSNNNDDTGTQPNYGLTCKSSVIMKNGTQPAGSTSNEITTTGGVIR
jgi:hypothetical protein